MELSPLSWTTPFPFLKRFLKAFPIEIKMAQTSNPSFTSHLKFWLGLTGNENEEGEVIYKGEKVVNSQSNLPSVPWYFL